MDLSYAHIFIKDSHINLSTNFQPAAGIQSLIANYSGNANLVGVQLNYHFNA